jgi:hypothetical protein
VIHAVERWLAQLEDMPRALRETGARLDFASSREPAGEK